MSYEQVFSSPQVLRTDERNQRYLCGLCMHPAKYMQIAKDIEAKGNNVDKATEDTIHSRQSLIETALAYFK